MKGDYKTVQRGMLSESDGNGRYRNVGDISVVEHKSKGFLMALITINGKKYSGILNKPLSEEAFKRALEYDRNNK